MLAAKDNHTQDRTAEADRQAYNAAFEELGLSWHWDPVTYACLPARGRDGLREYLQKEQAHLLRAYEADFLVNAIENAKARCYQVMLGRRASPIAHGVSGGEARVHEARIATPA